MRGTGPRTMEDSAASAAEFLLPPRPPMDAPAAASPGTLSRRRLLALSTAALLAGNARPLAAASARRAPPATPGEALERLLEGNRRFRSGAAEAPHATAERLREVEHDQHPFAAVLSCADSRVPVELVFDAGFGDLFVCRSAGNVAPPELVASLEYGAAVLGTTVILVLGHSSCGAVKAALAGEPVPGQISTLFWHIAPAIERAGPDPDAVIAENARIQAALLRRASPVLAGLVRDGRLLVVPAVYDLRTRVVTRV
jgi:carbonic anhydrase